MSFPRMNRQPKRTVAVPSLQGGVNLRDALNMCADNQLTDCLNMWFSDGILKTRPGERLLETWSFASGAAATKITFDSRADKKLCHRDITKIYEGKKYILTSFLSCFTKYKKEWTDSEGKSNDESKDKYSLLNFVWVGDSDYTPKYINNDAMSLSVEGIIENYIVTDTPKGLYLFLKSESYDLYKYNAESNIFEKLSDEDIYAPLVITHCKTNGSVLMTNKELVDGGGVMIEGYNLIGNRYRMIYSTVNRELLENDGDKHNMLYSLLWNTKEHIGSCITAMHISASGEQRHTVTITDDKGWNYEVFEDGKTPTDGLYMAVNGKMLKFCTDSEFKTQATVGADDFIEDNLEITAPCDNDAENLEKIFSMTRAEWFGGASQGINGGTRLFLGGNTKPTEKSLIVWSGLNEPLYFPESCEAYVGNSMSAVTAFGKQEDMLVIFKENELYYTKYTQNDSVTAESLINQSVVDYTATAVYFPLIQIHPEIGCGCPDTIRLCRNRLVWADTCGKVYTLTGANQYSERNVFCVSEMVERELRGKNLKAAYALDFGGHYMLIIGNRALLMDYNSYGYQYAYSYQKEEDANIKIPWYIWELLGDGASLYFDINDRLCSFYYGYAVENSIYGYTDSKIRLCVFDADSDNGQPIISMVQTKFFDFSAPNLRKNIENVGLSLGSNGGEAILLELISEAGSEYASINLFSDQTDSRQAGFIESRLLYPSLRSVVRFGIKFMCEGNMAIEGLNITYRTLGGAGK